MIETHSMLPRERPQPRRPLFLSPKVREENDETRTRANRLTNYIFEREELAGFENLAGEDEYVTLQEFFQIAEEAAQNGNKAKLVALKRLGESLLQQHMYLTDDLDVEAGVWEHVPESGKVAHKVLVRAAEMIILKAEMEYLKLRQNKKTLDSIPSSQKDALARQFRQYARNVDIPVDFQKELLAAHKMIKPVPAAVSDTAGSHESALEDHKPMEAETVAIRSATEETQIGAKTAAHKPPIAVHKPERLKRYPELDSHTIEWCIAKGTLPGKYWDTAQLWLLDELRQVGLADESHIVFLGELVQQVQYALHRNQQKGLGYWKFWGVIDWLSQGATRARVFSGTGWKNNLEALFKAYGKDSAKKIRRVRNDVAQAARRVVDRLTSSSQTLAPEQQVVVALLQLVADELEAVSQFEEEQIQKKAQKKALKKR